MTKKVGNVLAHGNINRFLFVLLIPILGNLSSTGKGKIDKAVFTGNIKSQYSDLTLRVGFFRYYIVGVGNEVKYQDFKVDKDGNFRFAIKELESVGRIIVYEKENYIQILNMDIVEPNDSINIQISVNQDKVTIEFSGRGYAKYKCLNDLNSVKYNIFYDIKDNPSLNQKYDSLKTVMESTILPYKSLISDSVYTILHNDLIGKLAYAYILSIFEEIPGNLSEQQFISLLTKFEKFAASVSGAGKTEHLSVDLVKYLFDKENTRMVLKNRGKKPSFKSFYQNIRKSYTGPLREQLITYSFNNKMALNFLFNGADPVEYKECLSDALQIVHIPQLRESILLEYNNRSYGAKFYNFAFPKDSSNQIVRLSDLKGKVILLDLWSYNCTGCHLFTKAFHERILPLFKSDTNFLVVSVMLDRSFGYEHYLKRLRESNKVTYTYPEYLNLFGDKNLEDARVLVDQYNINIYPTIFLIDKGGKIASSTIPYFNDPQSPNVSLLSDLIKKTLLN